MAQHELIIDDWRLRFPEFSQLTDAQIEMAWDSATSYIADYDNFLLSGKRLQLALNLMTAHIVQLRVMALSKDNSSMPTGVLTSASEGSVSVSFSPPPFKNGLETWLAMTPYGLELWALLSMAIAGGFYVGGKPETAAFRDVGGRFGFLQ